MGRRRDSDHPLMQGLTEKTSLTLPSTMVAYLKDVSLDDRVGSLSNYVSHMLLMAIELREEKTPTLEAWLRKRAAEEKSEKKRGAK